MTAPKAPQRGLARITHKELALLREKAAAHDQYLAATKVMRRRQIQISASLDEIRLENSLTGDPSSGWYRGWLRCLREFSEAVVTEQAKVLAPDALVYTEHEPYA